MLLPWDKRTLLGSFPYSDITREALQERAYSSLQRPRKIGLIDYTEPNDRWSLEVKLKGQTSIPLGLTHQWATINTIITFLNLNRDKPTYIRELK